jgi:methyl-accepting chemotaxis protein
MQGKHISELVSEEKREWLNGIWNTILVDNQSFKGNIRYVTRTGKELWAMTSLSIARHEDNSIDKIMLLGLDIMEERDQLLKQEAIVASMDNLGISIELDINGNILDANKNFVNLFKLSQKEVKSFVIFDIINPIELEGFNKQWEAVINGKGYSGILRGKATDGTDIWLTGSFNATQNVAHEVEHIVFVGIDITHEKNLETESIASKDLIKKQEKQIKDSEKELVSKLRELKTELLGQFKDIEKIKNLNENMLEDSPDAIVTTSHDNRIVFFNKAAEHLWQMDRKDVLDQDITILFPEVLIEKDELLDSFTRPGNHKITGKRRKSIIIDKNGKEKAVLIMLTKTKVDNENAYMAFIQNTGH